MIPEIASVLFFLTNQLFVRFFKLKIPFWKKFVFFRYIVKPCDRYQSSNGASWPVATHVECQQKKTENDAEAQVRKRFNGFLPGLVERRPRWLDDSLTR